MYKVNKPLSCPYCHANGPELSHFPIDKITKKETDDATLVNIKRTYNCHCKKCNKNYQVPYGKAKLTRYKPYTSGTCIGDVRVYVKYESEFDRSYSIVDVQGIMMMIVEEDEYPMVIANNEVDALINNHKKTKSEINCRWMCRYR